VNGAGQSLRYFAEPFLARVVKYPMLWIYLCDRRVSEVRGRLADPVDDEDVYVLRETLRWESPEFAVLFPS